MNRMIEIERLSKELENNTNEILNKNFPMDSREFLTGEDAERVKKNDEIIKQLANEYLETYKNLQFDVQREYDYKNIQGTYYQNTHKSKGLVKAYSNSDEYELHKAFSKAYNFGMSAIDNIYSAKMDENETEVIKNKKILDECIDIFKVHFWGEERIKSLERYCQRKETGRTNDDDIREYMSLIEECKKVSLDYAKANVNGISDVERTEYLKIYEDIFDREKKLIEFLPREVLNEVEVNLHWLKVDAERNPRKLIDEDQEIEKPKTK